MNDLVQDVTYSQLLSYFDTEEKFKDFEKFFVASVIEDAHYAIERKDLLLPVIKDEKYGSYAVLVPFFFDVIARYVGGSDSIKRQKIANMLKLDGIVQDTTAHLFIVVSVFEILHGLFNLNSVRMRRGGSGYLTVELKWFALSVYSASDMAKEVMVLPFKNGVIGTIIDRDGEMQQALADLQEQVPHRQEAFGPTYVKQFWEDQTRKRGQEKIVLKKWSL